MTQPRQRRHETPSGGISGGKCFLITKKDASHNLDITRKHVGLGSHLPTKRTDSFSYR